MAVVELEPFNVETGNYQTTIQGWRRRLGEISGRHSHNRPVLPLQEQPPEHFFDIVLRRNAQSTQSLRVRFNRGNFYLVGYQMANQQWLEFDNKDKTHLITGSTFLGFDGSYLALERKAKLELESVILGKGALLTAVDQLPTATTQQDRAQSLIVVIMMICESSRLIPISDRLTLTYRNGKKIAPWMTDLVHQWETFSKVLLRADAYPEERFTLPTVRIPKDLTSNDVSDDKKIYKITTLAEAATIIGILLGLIFRRDA